MTRPPAWIKHRLAEVDATKHGKKARPRGAAMKRPEQELQITCASFLRVATIPPARWWFVPNGGNLSKAQAAKFKEMGLVPGVSDLHFAWAVQSSVYTPETGELHPPGMFGVIELKAPGTIQRASALSPEQVAFQRDLAACGHHTGAVDSLEALVALLTRWGYQLRPVKL